MRSTKIRLLSGHFTSIPNDDVAKADIENFAERPHIKRTVNVTITYDTPPEKIDKAINILEEIIYNASGTSEGPTSNIHINNPKYPLKVYFNEFNSDSLNTFIIYWYETTGILGFPSAFHSHKQRYYPPFQRGRNRFCIPKQNALHRRRYYARTQHQSCKT
mgnify:CR=1 FL=1